MKFFKTFVLPILIGILLVIPFIYLIESIEYGSHENITYSDNHVTNQVVKSITNSDWKVSKFDFLFRSYGKRVIFTDPHEKIHISLEYAKSDIFGSYLSEWRVYFKDHYTHVAFSKDQVNEISEHLHEKYYAFIKESNNKQKKGELVDLQLE